MISCIDKKFLATLQVDSAGRSIVFSDFKQEKAKAQKQEKAEMFCVNAILGVME